MNGIIDVYENHFNNLVSFQFDLQKRNRHDCLICSTDITEGIYPRKFIEEFIINYLEHLKVFGYSIKLCKIFIKSVRENGILCLQVKGQWLIKKHDKHEVFVIEHVNINNKEKEKENEIEFLKQVPVHPRDRLKKHLERGFYSDL